MTLRINTSIYLLPGLCTTRTILLNLYWFCCELFCSLRNSVYLFMGSQFLQLAWPGYYIRMAEDNHADTWEAWFKRKISRQTRSEQKFAALVESDFSEVPHIINFVNSDSPVVLILLPWVFVYVWRWMQRMCVCSGTLIHIMCMHIFFLGNNIC